MTESKGSQMELPWHQDQRNLVLLTRWMADNDYTADQVAYAVEKPWKHEDEFKQAVEAAQRSADA
jgi:hypothetical protein